jgi:riboflavin kinase/FMN adenylyltransferase
MQVFRGIPTRPSGPIALTIGNFDGLHLGHQAMLTRLIGTARERRLPATVMTFEPHPREFFAPLSAPTRLSSLREKLELLSGSGVDRVHLCRFNQAFARTSAADFATHLLHEQLQTRWLLIGDDFRFGAKRAGNCDLLSHYASRLGFELAVMPPVEISGRRVSSTLVREALAAGDMQLARTYLGRYYSISGRVMHGDKIGRGIGFPTANVQMKHNRPPVAGIFAVNLYGVAERALSGVASLGTRPTVTKDGGVRLEVHLFDFSGDLYGCHVRVEFLHKLRDEAHYPDLETLTAQIERDARDARRYFETALHD